MRERTRKILLRFCWFLESVADKLTGDNADWFYPSRYFEKHPSLGRHGNNRIASRGTIYPPKELEDDR